MIKPILIPITHVNNLRIGRPENDSFLLLFLSPKYLTDKYRIDDIVMIAKMIR
ncbi:hypothetical protein AN1V17_51770 [Vallitalea sediminicola]|uniref:Uncharacterized protein n=1 Tax=Vallitalea maricola TaxID=3074433 RepID=A0ACB5UNH2_9FIRM|nr:hypothetical protein AN2V17_33220 [Vallitalea sp. AN17-2]